MPRPRVHLLCNAHIDPVWLWEWPEGAGEALATFRLAAEFCEHDGSFVFCHNEALLYRWIEEYEPELFERIRKLVRCGRWNILGGWWVQPDCNMPSGESFVRQILLGRRYFLAKFGVEPRVASNLDPFGHTRGLVQILARSGYRGYLYCRPGRKSSPFPADEFVWTGADGSEVLAVRAEAHYNSRGGGARAKVEEWIKTHPDRESSLVLWGIGNHGGGPSRRDLQDLKKLSASTTGIEIFHSTADAYFHELEKRKDDFPRISIGLNPWAPGCYTSMAQVKQRHRRLENELYSAEKMAAAAHFQGLAVYPGEDLAEATRDLAFSEFHDLLPGSSIPAGEEGVIRLLDHGLEIASRVKTRAFFALVKGETSAKEGEIPLFIHNLHPWPIRAIVEAEFQDHEPNYDKGYLLPIVTRNGKAVVSQPEKEASNLSVDWRKKVVFEADLVAGGMTRYGIRLDRIPAKPAPVLRAEDGGIRFLTAELDWEIDGASGLLRHLRVRGEDILDANASRLLIVEDDADPWGMKATSYRRVAWMFTLADPAAGTALSGVTAGLLPSVRVVEDGPVRSVVEAVFTYGHSAAFIRYFLPKRGTDIEVEIRVLWNEKDKMLKWSLPTRLSPAVYWGQTAFGRDILAADGAECVAQKWTAVVSRDRDLAFSIVNDGTHGSDFADGEVRISLLRSPAHAADPDGPALPSVQDRAVPRIDQGEHVFRFLLQTGARDERLDGVERDAAAFNEKPYILACFPPGLGAKAVPAVVCDDRAVVLSTMKKSEDGNDLILRFFEPTGRKREAKIELPFAGAQTSLIFGPFEIKTVRFNLKTRRFREVDLLERGPED